MPCYGAKSLSWVRGVSAGFPPDLESTRMWDASLENAKQPSFGICSIRSSWLQVPSFPHARPRMCRREVLVAALSLIEAHSHTLLKQFPSQDLVGSNFRDAAYGTICSRVWESWGSPDLWYASTRKPRGESAYRSSGRSDLGHRHSESTRT